MRDIDETRLPGVGMRHDFVTNDGARVGVISHRSGRKELLVYDREDPDACSETLWLDEDEGHALAEMLGGATVAANLKTLTQEVEGLAIDWVRVVGDAAAVNQPLRQFAAMSERGAIVVAVQRGEDMRAVPGTDFTIREGDIAVIVGTPAGVDEIAAQLRGPG